MLKIAAVFRHQQLLHDAADDLRAQLLALSGQSFRRINRYIELALYGAIHCARVAGRLDSDTAIYLASEAPMLADCIKALKTIEAEARPPTPFEFMNISGNMAGFYIAQHLQLNGPQVVTHRSGCGLEAALELLSLRSAAHRRSLLGYVEEGIWPLSQQRARLGLPADTPLLECSHWLYLDSECAQPLALLDAPQQFGEREAAASACAELPSDWRVLLGSGCDRDDIAALQRIRSDAAPHAQLGWSNGHTAAAVAAYAERPDTPGLAHLNRSGDGGYYLLKVRAPLEPATKRNLSS